MRIERGIKDPRLPDRQLSTGVPAAQPGDQACLSVYDFPQIFFAGTSSSDASADKKKGSPFFQKENPCSIGHGQNSIS